LLSISLAGAAARSRFVAGWWSADWPDTFVFYFGAGAGRKRSAEISNLLANAGKDLVLSVPDAQGEGPSVTARFQLPEDSAGLQDVLAPCLRR
jgi:hypothetical protein